MPTIRTNENPPPDVQCVPSDFHILEASGTSDFYLEAADDDDGQSRKLRRFRMTAYTGGKLLLANFPYPVVVDLSGLRIPTKSRPILRDHDSSRIVGHTESIEINGSSIRLGGIVSGSNDHAREVSDSGDNGFPWQASLGATAQRRSSSLIEAKSAEGKRSRVQRSAVHRAASQRSGEDQLRRTRSRRSDTTAREWPPDSQSSTRPNGGYHRWNSNNGPSRTRL